MLAFSIGTVLASPFVGGLVERAGVRAIAMLGQVGLAIGMLLISCAQQPIWTFYLAWFALSVLGVGTSPIVWSRAVAGAFERRRGLALGIMLCGTGLAGILGPLVTGHLIAAFGWRDAYRLLAASQIVIGLPFTFLVLQTGAGTAAVSSASLSGISLSAALRLSSFWRLAFAFVLISIVVAGLIVHLPAMLVDRGSSPAAAAATVAMLGYAVIVGRLSLGLLLDRLPANLVGAAFVLIAAVTCLLLANGVGLMAAVLLLGLCAGAEVDLLAFISARLFGLRHYAQIYGCTMSAFAFGAGLGPIAAGAIHDWTGRYTAALYGFAIAITVAAALIGSLRSAEKPT
jgi:MFS family permease